MAALRWPDRSEDPERSPATDVASFPGGGWFGDNGPKTSLPTSPSGGKTENVVGGPRPKRARGLRRLLNPLVVSSAAALCAAAIGMALVGLAGKTDAVVGAVPVQAER